MLTNPFTKKKKTGEAEKPHVTREEVSARLKGLFQDAMGQNPAGAEEDQSSLKRRAASAAAAALVEEDNELRDDEEQAGRVERAGTDVRAAAAILRKAALANGSTAATATRPAPGPSFRDISRDIEAHLATLRQANADIQSFLSERSAASPSDADFTTGRVQAEPVREAGPAAEATVPDETELSATDAATDVVREDEARAEERDAAEPPDQDVAFEPEPDAAFDGGNPDASMEEMTAPTLPEASEEADEDTPTAEDVLASPDDDVLETPAVAPDIEDLAERTSPAEDNEPAPEAVQGPVAKQVSRSDRGSIGDQIASMSAEEHERKLRDLEALVTGGGFEGEDESQAGAEETEAEDAPAGDEADEADAAAEQTSPSPEDVSVETVSDEGETGQSPAIAVPLLLSREAVGQDDDTAAHELNAQICDFLLFDAGVEPEELTDAAFMGWAVDFLWRNAAEGGLARFAHLSIGRPEIWKGVVSGLEALDAENHLRVVEALQALLAQDVRARRCNCRKSGCG